MIARPFAAHSCVHVRACVCDVHNYQRWTKPISPRYAIFISFTCTLRTVCRSSCSPQNGIPLHVKRNERTHRISTCFSFFENVSNSFFALLSFNCVSNGWKNNGSLQSTFANILSTANLLWVVVVLADAGKYLHSICRRKYLIKRSGHCHRRARFRAKKALTKDTYILYTRYIVHMYLSLSLCRQAKLLHLYSACTIHY